MKLNITLLVVRITVRSDIGLGNVLNGTFVIGVWPDETYWIFPLVPKDCSTISPLYIILILLTTFLI